MCEPFAGLKVTPCLANQRLNSLEFIGLNYEHICCYLQVHDAHLQNHLTSQSFPLLQRPQQLLVNLYIPCLQGHGLFGVAGVQAAVG
jgi:hypothetical protein